MNKYGNKTLLVVPAGPTQLPAIEFAVAQGLKVIALDANSGAGGLRAASIAEVGDITDEILIKEVAEKYRADGILSFCCDASLRAAAIACESLGLNSVSLETAVLSTNKYQQRQLLETLGLQVPKFNKITENFEIDALRNNLDYPLVVKPVDAAGSRGVSLVAGEEGLEEAIVAALKSSPSKNCLLESFVEGTEYAIDAIVVDGLFYPLCLSEKVRTSPPYLLDKEVHFPASLSQAEAASFWELAAAVCKAAKIEDAPLHMEVIKSPCGLVVVEFACRGAGFLVFTEILPYLTRINLIEASIDIALGLPLEFKPVEEHSRRASLVFIDPVPGILTSISGLEKARAVPGVSEVRLYAQPGDTLGFLTSGADRIGHIICYSDDGVSSSASARNSAKSSASHIRIEVSPC